MAPAPVDSGDGSGDGPEGWLRPQIPPGANVLSESPIAYTLDNLLSGASRSFVLCFPSSGRRPSAGEHACRGREEGGFNVFDHVNLLSTYGVTETYSNTPAAPLLRPTAAGGAQSALPERVLWRDMVSAWALGLTGCLCGS